MVNKGRIQRELRYFQIVLQIWSKLDKKLRWEIRDFSNFIKRTSREIYGINNHSIWIKIHGEIKEQNLDIKIFHEET